MFSKSAGSDRSWTGAQGRQLPESRKRRKAGKVVLKEAKTWGRELPATGHLALEREDTGPTLGYLTQGHTLLCGSPTGDRRPASNRISSDSPPPKSCPYHGPVQVNQTMMVSLHRSAALIFWLPFLNLPSLPGLPHASFPPPQTTTQTSRRPSQSLSHTVPQPHG